MHLLKATTKLWQIVDLLCCRVGERGGKKRKPTGMEPLGVGRHMQLKHKHRPLCKRNVLIRLMRPFTQLTDKVILIDKEISE